jgi:hypothetical protein
VLRRSPSLATNPRPLKDGSDSYGISLCAKKKAKSQKPKAKNQNKQTKQTNKQAKTNEDEKRKSTPPHTHTSVCVIMRAFVFDMCMYLNTTVKVHFFVCCFCFWSFLFFFFFFKLFVLCVYLAAYTIFIPTPGSISNPCKGAIARPAFTSVSKSINAIPGLLAMVRALVNPGYCLNSSVRLSSVARSGRF